MSVVRIGELLRQQAPIIARPIPKRAGIPRSRCDSNRFAQVVAITELTLPHIPLRR
jgi:hypothetical protein